VIDNLALPAIAGGAFGFIVVVVLCALFGACEGRERDPHEDGFVVATP
jgi:hypothetical protein